MAHVAPHRARAARAEVPDEQPHRPARAREPARRPPPPGALAQQPVVGVPCIGVRHHDARRHPLPVHQPHARGAAPLDGDLVHLGAEAHPAPLPLDHARHRLRQRRHAAHRVVDAEGGLQVADEDVHRGHAERVAADEERMEAQRHAQPRVAHPRGGVGMDRAVGSEPREGRQDAHRLAPLVHRAAAEILEPHAVARLRVAQEAVVAGQVRGRHPRHLGPHRGGVLVDRQARPVGPADLVERVQRAQVHVRVEVAPAGGPEVPQRLRHRDDGGPEVEPMPLAVERRAPPAGRVEPVQHGDGVAHRAQPHGGGEAADAGADHDGLRGARGGGRWVGAVGAEAGQHILTLVVSIHPDNREGGGMRSERRGAIGPGRRAGRGSAPRAAAIGSPRRGEGGRGRLPARSSFTCGAADPSPRMEAWAP